MKTLTNQLREFAEFIGFRETGRKLVSNYLRGLPKDEIIYDIIQEVVLDVLWIGSTDDFYNRKGCRRLEYVQCRAFMFLFARLLTPLSFREIGEPFGKDHATALISIRTLLQEMYLQKNKRAFDLILAEFALRGYMIGDNVKKVIS